MPPLPPDRFAHPTRVYDETAQQHLAEARRLMELADAHLLLAQTKGA